MTKTLLIYSPLSEIELASKVEAHQEEFEILLGDSFSDDELESHELVLESIASIEVQPLIDELTFEDLNSSPGEEALQRAFFAKCKSCICLENLPYLENNPFQVTYLIDLLWMLDEVLIDPGGMNELVFKKTYLNDLKSFKSMESILPKPNLINHLNVAGPMDMLLTDVYREYDRVSAMNGPAEAPPEKNLALYELLSQRLTADDLLRQSKMIPKDFGDRLESLKFFLKKQ